MRPDLQVSIAGQDRTAILKTRLLSLTATDATDPEADEVELVFDDAGAAIALPPHGAVIQLCIGYVGQPLVARGAFTVDETELEGPEAKITVRGKSADMRATLKAHRSRAWRATTVGAIVGAIAAEHGLQPHVHSSLAGVAVAHRDQTNESNLHFLSRLGRHHDAVASAKAGRLLFVPKGLATSASGGSLPAVAFTRGDLTSWSRKDTDRAKHGSVRGRRWDHAKAANVYSVAGGDDPVRTLRHGHPSDELALAHAHGEHRRGKRRSSEVELVLPGAPQLFAGRPVNVSGVRSGIDGAWIVAKCEQAQDFDSAGFTTTLTCTADGYLEDSGDAVSGYGGDDPDSTASEEGAE